MVGYSLPAAGLKSPTNPPKKSAKGGHGHPRSASSTSSTAHHHPKSQHTNSQNFAANNKSPQQPNKPKLSNKNCRSPTNNATISSRPVILTNPTTGARPANNSRRNQTNSSPRPVPLMSRDRHASTSSSTSSSMSISPCTSPNSFR